MKNFNLYFLASAFMVIIGLIMIISARYLWSLPFFGGALALYFVGKGQAYDEGGGDDARR
ncbi:MAG: hypothetical protein KUG65_06300 [Sphingomonadaceae bacterium]|nr:hypothetical protein [Sphingomonadaceae bacterium]